MAENSVDGLVKEIQTENERLKHFIDNYSIDQTDGPSDYVEIWNQKVVTILEKIPVVSTSIETKKNNIIQSLERTETELDGLKKTVTDLWDQINQFDSNAEKYKLQLKEEIIKIQRKSKTIKEQYTKKNGDLEKEVKNLNVKLRKTTKLERDLSKVTKENEKYKEEIDELYQHKSDLEDEIIKYKTLLNQLTNKVNTTDETPEDTSPGNNQPEQPDDPSDGQEPETENPSGNNDEPNAAPTDPESSEE
ncbi:uncharacterized protein LOC108246838 [Kryptolebias marmoratus]|uniref:uncharacterized protein LOC108246838 n=1 Tax=Kryptolebias marmoratus TaxID=37003 RepID=UPI0007F915E2|nr:uncharacterized protein LOC108246838 [Kryptolebias marmoratus]XP_024865935.1 uncharacterized protein LOC108246838 [Kryptolebias marmoratus]